jgi:hypothetical protein
VAAASPGAVQLRPRRQAGLVAGYAGHLAGRLGTERRQQRARACWSGVRVVEVNVEEREAAVVSEGERALAWVRRELARDGKLVTEPKQMSPHMKTKLLHYGLAGGRATG